MATPRIWINGKFYDKQDAKISVYDHGLLYGDGVFEGIRVYEGNIFRLKQHVDRIYDSARSIHLEIPLSKSQFADAIRATVRAIFTDREFYSPAVIRSQHKTHVEHIVGAMRGLDATGSRGTTLFYTLFELGHVPYFPPSVFSFYRPGHKGSQVNAASVAMRDQAADLLANNRPSLYSDAFWDAGALLRRQHRNSVDAPSLKQMPRRVDRIGAQRGNPTRKVLR